MKRFVMVFVCIFAFISTLMSCDNGSEAKNKILLKEGENKITDNNDKKTVKTKDYDYDIEKIDLEVIKGNKEFSLKIFKQLNEESLTDSIFISPFGISQTLTMTYNGAETTTKECMEDTLGLSGLDRTVINESFQNLTNYLAQIDDKVKLDIANSIWIREGEKIQEEFVRSNETNFDAEVDILDFSDSKAVDTINGWIEKATYGKINKMLKAPIPSDTIMYMINAIYFKGEWSEQFDPKLTYQDDFTTLEGKVKNVNMMQRKINSVEYTGNEEYKAVRLPYGDRKISMYLLLPEEGTDINELIKNLTIDKLAGIKKTVTKKEDIVLRIPRFRLEYGMKELNDSLIALGMGEAFGSKSDFTGIREDVSISRVLHKAIIEVNEEGSEATAATVVEMVETAVAEPLTFIADRPFVFFINDDVMDTILFMGKVVSIEE